jgi:hypothetical protein
MTVAELLAKDGIIPLNKVRERTLARRAANARVPSSGLLRFLMRAYIRHELSNYDALRKGRRGNAYLKIRGAINARIDALYPELVNKPSVRAAPFHFVSSLARSGTEKQGAP